MTGIRAALYLRISKDDAQTGLAVERQRDECLDVIDREKLELVHTYVDNAKSAYARNVKRPQFDQMTEDYEAGRFDVVVCWDMDRFSRQPAQLENWIGLGEERGLKIVTPTEVTDLSTDNGRMFARMKATIARAEVERKSARQKAQTAQAKANGTFRGRVGYDDADVIRRIFKLIRTGTGPYQIAKTLNGEGLTTITGNTWSGQAVRRVAMTPRHRGSLIPVDEYDAVQAIVTRGERVGAKAKGRYSGVARCSTCQSSMTASGPKYTCAYATNHPGSKGHHTISRAVLDKLLDAAAVAALLDPAYRLDDDPVTESLREVDAEIGELAARKADLLSGLSDGLSMADIRPHLAPVTKALDAAQGRRERILEASTQASILAGLLSDAIGSDGARLLLMPPLEAKGVVTLRLNLMDGEKRRELARGLLEVQIVPGRGPERVSIERKKRQPVA